MTLTLATGTPLSRFSFGTMQWGGGADAAEARRLYDRCREAGITAFDTAVGYTEGRAETLLGQFVKAERDAVHVATKIGYDRDHSPATLTAQWDRSRRQSGLEQVDLLYLHRWSGTDLAATFDWLAARQEAGEFRQIGVSNFAAWQVMKAQGAARAAGTRIDALQPMLNLVKRQAQVELLPMAEDQGIAVLSYSPLGGGLLTGKYARGETGRIRSDSHYAARYAPDWMSRAAEDLSALAAETGHDPATLAVAWVAARGVTPIISARSTEQLAPSLAAMSLDLDPELDARLSALTPTPPPATDRLEEA